MKGSLTATPPRERLLLLLLVGVVLLTFSPAGAYEFVNVDDDLYVTENERVRGGMSWENVRWAMTTMEAAFWHPLTWWSHMLDWEVYGENAGGHHVTNVVLHGVNVVLLYGVLWRMTGGVWSSAMVAGLFGLHPLNVESVAWVAERKNVLSTLFWLMTMWGYVGYVRKGGVWRYGSVLGWFVLGLMAKPMLVTLPCVLLLLDYWPLGRWGEGKERRERWKRLVWEKVPMLGVVGVVSVWAVQAQAKAGALSGLEGLPVGVRLGNAVVAYGEYLRKMVWPMDLAVFYPHAGESLEVWKVVMWGVVLMGITGGVWKWGEKYGYLRVGWLWYVGTLVPVSGLVQVGGHGLADRYAYVPLIGVFVMVVWGMAEIARRRPWSRGWIVLASLLVLAALSVGTRTQLYYWSSTRSLFDQALRVTSNNYVAHRMIGTDLMKKGRRQEAIQSFRESIRAGPRYPDAYSKLGAALLEQEQLDEAERLFSDALEINQNAWEALNNLGIVQLKRGELTEATRLFTRVIELDPGYSGGYSNLGLTLAGQGRFSEAVSQYARALRITPDFYDAHNNLGVALMEMGEMQGASVHLARAVAIDPHLAEARTNLGLAIAKQGRTEEAARHFSLAVQIQPDFAQAYYYLALAWTEQGRLPEAMTLYREALKRNPELEAARQRLNELVFE